MALKTYDSKDAVPEALRADYIEKDGKWVPDVEGAEDVTGLKRNHAELKQDAQRLRDKLKAYDGVDAEEYKRLKAAADDAEAKAAKAAGNWEAREKQLKEQFERDLKQATDQLAAMTSTVDELVVENELRRELAEVAVDVDLALPHLRRGIRAVKDGDRYRAQVVDEKGNERIADSKGTPMSIKHRVKEWAEDQKNAPLVKGTQANGSGGRGSGNGGGSTKTIAAGDPKAFLDNLEGIATGKVVVGG